jgi:hypothetical protein
LMRGSGDNRVSVENRRGAIYAGPVWLAAG